MDSRFRPPLLPPARDALAAPPVAPARLASQASHHHRPDLPAGGGPPRASLPALTDARWRTPTTTTAHDNDDGPLLRPAAANDPQTRPLPPAAAAAAFPRDPSSSTSFPPTAATTRPRPSNPSAHPNRSAIHRLSVAVRSAFFAPLLPPTTQPLFAPSSSSPPLANDQALPAAPSSLPLLRQPISHAPRPRRPDSPPPPPSDTARLASARTLAASLLGPPLPLAADRRDVALGPSRTGAAHPPGVRGLEQPLVRPKRNSPPPPPPPTPLPLTAADVDEGSTRVAHSPRRRAMLEAAELEERKRRSMWFTARAAGELALTEGGGGRQREWEGLTRDELMDVVRFSPADKDEVASVAPRRPPYDASLASALGPSQARSTAAAPSLYSATSVSSDDDDDDGERLHLATAVSPTSTDGACSPWDAPSSAATAVEKASRLPSAQAFRNPFPLQPSASKSSASSSTLHPPPTQHAAPSSTTAHLSSSLSACRVARKQHPADHCRPQRIGVHPELYTRETLGRRMREVDWGADEEGRRRTESVFLE